MWVTQAARVMNDIYAYSWLATDSSYCVHQKTLQAREIFSKPLMIGNLPQVLPLLRGAILSRIFSFLRNLLPKTEGFQEPVQLVLGRTSACRHVARLDIHSSYEISIRRFQNTTLKVQKRWQFLNFKRLLLQCIPEKTRNSVWLPLNPGGFTSHVMSFVYMTDWTELLYLGKVAKQSGQHNICIAYKGWPGITASLGFIFYLQGNLFTKVMHWAS